MADRNGSRVQGNATVGSSEGPKIKEGSALPSAGGGSTARYKMRAIDASNDLIVWISPAQPDWNGDLYSGPKPLSSVAIAAVVL